MTVTVGLDLWQILQVSFCIVTWWYSGGGGRRRLWNSYKEIRRVIERIRSDFYNLKNY